jgi:pantoate--beta-alanine ligase
VHSIKDTFPLIEESSKENDITVASIFVNPTQFDKKEDLDNYPETLENDLNLLEKIACDVVFIPSVE